MHDDSLSISRLLILFSKVQVGRYRRECARMGCMCGSYICKYDRDQPIVNEWLTGPTSLALVCLYASAILIRSKDTASDGVPRVGYEIYACLGVARSYSALGSAAIFDLLSFRRGPTGLELAPGSVLNRKSVRRSPADKCRAYGFDDPKTWPPNAGEISSRRQIPFRPPEEKVPFSPPHLVCPHSATL